MKNSTFVTNEPVDELASLLQDRHVDRRQDIWLWLHLYIRRNEKLDPETCNGQTMRNEIAKYLRWEPILQNFIPTMKDQLLLPKKTLEWIENDERQPRWLLPRIEEITYERLPNDLIRLSGRDRVIAAIDIWEATLQRKALAVERLQEAWLNHKLKDRDFKWFTDQKDGTKRCIYAWEWIDEHYLRKLSLHSPFSNYQELLIFFDQERMDQYRQRAIVNKIRTKWNNAQHKKRTAHMKQINVKIPLEVVNQLKTLQEKHDLSSAKVVEKLIRMEIQKGDYLTST